MSIEAIPGTVSSILWHFPGGPEFDFQQGKQKRTPKLQEKAYEALQGILEEMTIHESTYSEKVESDPAQSQSPDLDSRPHEEGKTSFSSAIETAQVCCLADIPAQHLNYHASRYGKFGIGYYRAAAIKAGFQPVLYSLKNQNFAQNIFKLDSNYSSLTKILTSLQESLNERCTSSEIKNDVIVAETLKYIDLLKENISELNKVHRNLFAFVKTFDEKDFSTIYTEREWRKIGDFPFNQDDIAMILAPRNGPNETDYHSLFLNSHVCARLPRRVPVVAWEDLLGVSHK